MLARSYFLVIAMIVATLTSGVLAYYQDDLYTVFTSWASGEPKIMVKLEIPIPYIENVDKCVVVVRRLPSFKRPTVNGYSEDVYAGVHQAGDTVVIKQLLHAIVAKYRLDPKTGDIKVDYYEPVEYFILVKCADKHGNTYEYARIHQVFPRHLVTRYVVDVKLRSNLKFSLDHDFNGGGGGYEYPGLKCNIYITESSYWGEHGWCKVWVRGPAIYSLSGLRTSFLVKATTVAYIESFVDSCLDYECVGKNYPSWRNAGKKETRSGVGTSTFYLSGDYVDRVYFWVTYNYEYSCSYYNGFAKVTICYWFLYPFEVRDVQLSSVLYPDVPYEKSSYYPSNPPPYAEACRLGYLEVHFNVTDVTDISLSEIEIGVGYKGIVVYVRLKFYKAVRSDVATPPELIVEDVSGITYRWYRWWYRDDNKSAMEVLFCRC